MAKCDRCGCETTMSKMSWFNEDMLCPSCQEKEEAHPDYAKAKAADNFFLINKKNYNFPGIGKPADL